MVKVRDLPCSSTLNVSSAYPPAVFYPVHINCLACRGFPTPDVGFKSPHSTSRSSFVWNHIDSNKETPFSLMFLLLSLIGVAGLDFVEAQIAETNATCTSDYQWMGSQKGSSPCQVVAQLDAQCNNGRWDIPALTPATHYTNPINEKATICTCSWASYNLISACTACQGRPENIVLWGDYITGCSGQTTTNHTFWPATIPFPEGVTVPYWAGTDPTTWTNQKFTPSDAKNIYQQSHPDYTAAVPSATPSATPSAAPTSSNNTGAIVGGVIGGLVAIAAFTALLVLLICRRRRAGQGGFRTDDRAAHMRKISDSTVTSGMATLRDPSSIRTVQTPPLPVRSRSSVAFFSSLIGRDSRATMGHTPTPQEPGVPSLEEVINPYVLPPANDTPEKKHSDGDWPVFDQPDAPPPNAIRMTVVPSSQTPPRKITRYNPPSYSESVENTPLSATTSRHHPQDSFDSELSIPLATTTTESTTDHVQRRGLHTPANSGSSIGHMGISSTNSFRSGRRTSVDPSLSRGYGRSLYMGGSLEAISPTTEESFSPSDLA